MIGPDRIFAIAWETDAGHGEWDVLNNDGTEYTRRDPAVLAALPEVQALIAAAYEVAAKVVDTCNAEGPYQSIGAAGRIRAITPSEATAALEAINRAERNKARREAAEWHHQEGWKLDEDAVPGAILAMLEPENEE